MKTDDLRRTYLDFFKERNHTLFPSDTLIPADTTLLFTSAGMNQFKPYFLGEKKDPKRAVSCQRCLRTGDLHQVGKTPCHHTFFEMLGNFSFGDYFKREAIEMAWEFLTQKLKIQPDALWVSVYNDDDEAYAIWRDKIGVDKNKIVRLGAHDNFWPADALAVGPNGPCGPCSEIFFDRGREFCARADCSPACSCRRFVEIWNLVFTQFNRVGENKVEPLPQKNIDTGMGLERMAAVLQHKESNFEIDILMPLVERVKNILSLSGSVPRECVYAIVDHARAAVFSVNDGIYPSNEERGYVVRKIIRKAAWEGYVRGARESFLYKLVDDVVLLMRGAYPEIAAKKETITKVIRVEEERFLERLKEGRRQFSVVAEEARQDNKNEVAARDAFKLYDTYGLPFELVSRMARDEGLGIDKKGFESLLKAQKQRSRQASMFDDAVFSASGIFRDLGDSETEFLGYSEYRVQAGIVFIHDGEKQTACLESGREGALVLDKTVFYPEGGGQLCDLGTIRTDTGEFVVRSVRRIEQAIVHHGIVSGGAVKLNQNALVQVDLHRRNALARAHSATHILQAALRQILGEHVSQQGSLVDEDRLRFDFTHFKSLSEGDLTRVEAWVNDRIFDNLQVEKKIVSLDEAKRCGALAFFKDKYKEDARMVSAGNISRELCGGMHVNNTCEIGHFAIVGESSIASGIRRIEAVVGKRAQKYIDEVMSAAVSASSVLKCSPRRLPGALSRLQEELNSCRQKVRELNRNMILARARKLSDAAQTVEGHRVVVAQVEDADKESILTACDYLSKNGDLAVIFLSSGSSDGVFIIKIRDDLVERGLSCKKFIERFGKDLGLKGGGRDNKAQGRVSYARDGFDCKIKEAVRQMLCGL